MNKDFWQGKRVFITGHTGFKGAWLTHWLQMLGANVTGFSLPVDKAQNFLFEALGIAEVLGAQHLEGDINDLTALKQATEQTQPDIILHLAAQSLVRLSYQQPLETLQTNVIGTANVLETARSLPHTKAVLVVTTDKCYENREWQWGYRENEALGGYDPYSSSKACAELVSSAYRRSFFAEGPNLATARAGNVIGGGDMANDRLIPDMIRAFSERRPVLIRNPNSVRPWQHVLEPLAGYMTLVEKLYSDNQQRYTSAWNFGPSDRDVKTVGQIADRLVHTWGENAEWQSDGGNHPHEASMLKLDSSKANTELGWLPRLSLDLALEWIVEWHKNADDAKSITSQQIERYSRMSEAK